MFYQRASKDLLVLILVVMLLIGVAGDALAQGLVEYALVLVHANPQSVDVQDQAGSDLGSGRFQATVMSNRRGPTNGTAELHLQSYTVLFKFSHVDEYIYDGDELVGLALSGRGRVTKNGRSEWFATTATVVRDTNTIPDCLIWDIPGAPVILGGFYFDVQGRLVAREGK